MVSLKLEYLFQGRKVRALMQANSTGRAPDKEVRFTSIFKGSIIFEHGVNEDFTEHKAALSLVIVSTVRRECHQLHNEAGYLHAYANIHTYTKQRAIFMFGVIGSFTARFEARRGLNLDDLPGKMVPWFGCRLSEGDITPAMYVVQHRDTCFPRLHSIEIYRRHLPDSTCP